MLVETRGQWAVKYQAVLRAEVQTTGELDTSGTAGAEEKKEVLPVAREEQPARWLEDPFGEMATGAGNDGKLRFSGKKGEGLTIKQFELMVKEILLSRFKKLQKDIGEPIAGAEFLGNYCIFQGEFPAKLAHEREYEAHCRDTDPVGALLKSLKRHFEDQKEGKAQEWVAFRREQGEELPSLLFRLQGLALDLEKPLKDKELVGKFVASLDRRLAEQTNAQAMASTVKTGGAYSLEEAYDVALMVSAGNARLKIARELVPRAAEAVRPRWGGRANGPSGAHAALQMMEPLYPAAVAAPVAQGGSGACHNCGETEHYVRTCPQPPQNSAGRGARRTGRGGGRGRGRGPCWVCGDYDHQAAQCAKRAVPSPQPQPAAIAVPTPRGGGMMVSEAELQAFQDWRATTQAAVAARVDEEEEDGSEWDDEEYALGAVALPAGCGGPTSMGAAGTKAGAEKARATRAAKQGAREPGTRAQPQGVQGAVEKAGTAGIVAPVDHGAAEALRARRDRGAAKERAAKLPDHGRHVAPQGLHRLPVGFTVKAAPRPGERQRRSAKPAGNAPPVTAAGHQTSHHPVLQSLQATNHLPGKPGPGPFPNLGLGQSQSVQGLAASGAEAPPPPVLTGGVHLDVATFLGLAERAGMSLTDVVALIRAQPGGTKLTRAVAAPPHPRGRNLSPVALKAQRAREESVGGPARGRDEDKGADKHEGPMAQWVSILK
jgi:hypothetical protein